MHISEEDLQIQKKIALVIVAQPVTSWSTTWMVLALLILTVSFACVRQVKLGKKNKLGSDQQWAKKFGK